MINVMHLRSSSGFYGAERSIVSLLRGLPSYNIHPLLVTIENYLNSNVDLLNTAKNNHIQASQVACKSRLSSKLFFDIRKLVLSNGINCLHVHDYKSLFYAFLISK